jgi:hypothetical protein
MRPDPDRTFTACVVGGCLLLAVVVVGLSLLGAYAW